MKTEEEYQEAIELNNEQVKAFAALERAFSRCKKENILFYQNMDKLGALNGNNVRCVDEGCDAFAPNCLQFKDYPIVKLVDPFADDLHYVRLYDE